MKNRTYRSPEAFHERRTREFGGKSGGSPFPRKKIEFGIGGHVISRGLGGLFSTLFSVDILSFLSSSPPPPHRISMQIWTNYETHIFKKWGGMYP